MQYDLETLRHLQLALLEMLHEIDDVCRKHDITYFFHPDRFWGPCATAASYPGTTISISA